MISQILHQKTFEKTVSLHNSKFISNKRMYMNRIKVFLLFAVWIGLNACQSKGKQAIEKEVGEDTLIIAPTEEEKTITGVVGDASTNHFAVNYLKRRYAFYQYKGSRNRTMSQVLSWEIR